MITVSEATGFDDVGIPLPVMPTGLITKAGAEAVIRAFKGYVMVQDSNDTPAPGAVVSLAIMGGAFGIPVPVAQAVTGADGQAALAAEVKAGDDQLFYMVSPPGEKKVNVTVKAGRNMTVIAKLKNWVLPVAAPETSMMLPLIIGGGALVVIGGIYLFMNRKAAKPTQAPAI